MEVTVMTEKQAPRVRHKTFHYRTSVQWLEGRAGLNRSDGKPAFRVASPPEFKGEEGVWTPEDLFVAAVNTCTMTTFAAFAAKRELSIDVYESAAEGTLEFSDGSYRFTQVVVRPRIVARAPATREMVEALVRDAHHSCLITNSISGEVVVEAEIEITG
jgi:organic hydroperoxide reductase OsmC/OhrA